MPFPFIALKQCLICGLPNDPESAVIYSEDPTDLNLCV